MNISINLHKVSSLCSHHLFSSINFTPTPRAVISWWVFPTLFFVFHFPSWNWVFQTTTTVFPEQGEPFHSSSLMKGKSQHTPLLTGSYPPPPVWAEPGWMVELQSHPFSWQPLPGQSKPVNMDLELVSASSKTRNKGYLSSPRSHLSSAEISSRKIKFPPVSRPFREATPVSHRWAPVPTCQVTKKETD